MEDNKMTNNQFKGIIKMIIALRNKNLIRVNTRGELHNIPANRPECFKIY